MKSVAIFCRHGNTFERGERVCWVGAKQDVPLTEEGVAQAHRIGDALRRSGVTLVRVAAAPLRRTADFATHIIGRMATAPGCEPDPRLVELDYGAWSGLTDREIEERFGQAGLLGWRDRGERPFGVSFSPSREVVLEQLGALLKEMQACIGTHLLVTSNGRLRELGCLLGFHGRGEAGSLSVSTGCSCLLIFEGDSWQVRAWNAGPDALEGALAG